MAQCMADSVWIKGGRMGRNRSLLAGLLVFGLLASMDVHAAELRFSDGNGNLFTFSEGDVPGAAPGSGVMLTYDPVMASQSSSGEYSGGEKRTVALSPLDGRRARTLFQQAIAAEASHVENREKGTCMLQWTDGEQGRTVLLRQGSVEGRAIEEFLRLCLVGISITYSIDRGADPWHGLTGTAEDEARSRHIRARTFPAEGFTPLVGPGLAWQGTPLLYRGKGEVALDGRFFSDMERADATRLPAGKALRMGVARTDEMLRPEFLVPFLLQSQLIITYWHTNAELHLVREYADGQQRCYLIEGEHHYFTNQHNVRSIRFSICSDTASREIQVRGE